MKKKRTKIRWKLFNPINMQTEIKKYENRFTWKKYILYLLVALTIAILSGTIFQLEKIYIVGVVLAFWLCIPFIVVDTYKRIYERNRFEEASRYIERIIYAFMQNGKIKTTLEDVSINFLPGTKMKNCIDQALKCISYGKSGDAVYKDAFAIIEAEYSNVKIARVHKYMINVEQHGGEYHKMAELLLEDKQNWHNNIYKLQIKKETIFKEICGATVISTLLCALFETYIFKNLPETMNIIKLPIIQIVSAALIIGQMLIIRFAGTKLVTNWLDREKREKDKDIIDNYRYLINFDNKKEKTKSLIFAAPFFIAALPLVFLTYKSTAIICMVIGVLMLFQHRLNYQLAYKSALKELKVAFPEWLMELSLLLQKNNVQVAIIETAETAPAILKDEIIQLQDRMTKYPSKIESYTLFFEIFKLSEIQTAMQTLFSISQTGNGDAGAEIRNLIKSNYMMREEADKILNENILAGMSVIFSLPLLLSCCNLIVNLWMFLVVALPAMAG